MSELRKDITSGEWVIISPSRATRPDEAQKKKEPRAIAPVAGCPFEDLVSSGNGPILMQDPEEGEWRIALIPNKYPVLEHAEACTVSERDGEYEHMRGAGVHDLVITRDHEKNFAHIDSAAATGVFDMFARRLRDLAKDECLRYASIFHAWGSTAGGTVFHPHYQILTLPIVPPEVSRSLRGFMEFSKSHKDACVHCEEIAIEEAHGSRVVYSDDAVIAFAPYASRQPFELRIFPRHHEPRFEEGNDADRTAVAAALQKCLMLIETHLNDPDYNFYIHTAPFNKDGGSGAYHWHVEVLPRITRLGGFEWGTGIDVNVVDPDHAARILRNDV